MTNTANMNNTMQTKINPAILGSTVSKLNETQWLEFKGKLAHRFDKVLDKDLELSKANFSVLTDRVSTIYGISRDAAEKQILEFAEKTPEVFDSHKPLVS